jgi:hypothetical protein
MRSFYEEPADLCEKWVKRYRNSAGEIKTENPLLGVGVVRLAGLARDSWVLGG